MMRRERGATEMGGAAPSVADPQPSVQQAVYEPEGLSKLWRNVKDYFYVWPFAYRRGEGR